MKIAFVIQRYGEEIIGGAEYFTRLIAERMIKFHEIEILTTCAKEYHNWMNEYPQGIDVIAGVPVRRFKNKKFRNMEKFVKIQEYVFNNDHTIDEEMQWVNEQGPYCPDLIYYIQNHQDDYDLFVFFTYRYFPSYYGANKIKKKSILVPFAENDPALSLKITSDLFSNVTGIIYSTPEERELINNNVNHPEITKKWDIIGCGIDSLFKPSGTLPVNNKSFILYLGRIEGFSKGCNELFDYYCRWVNEADDAPDLVLAGYDAIGVPKHDKIHYLGFVSEQEKINLLYGAIYLVMPSPYESFSIVTLESLEYGTPVLVNGKCSVLKGHCKRSNAGLWYNSFDEFVECSQILINNTRLRTQMSKNGIDYIKKFYSWSLIEEKYLQMFDSVHKL